MWNETSVSRILKIQTPIIQGPFGGGLSSTTLLAAVSNAGGLGSFGAHHLSAAEILATANEARKLTDRPFALNLWVSDHDGSGLKLSHAEFEAALTLLRPYFKELNLAEPAYPIHGFGQRFEEQIEAIFEARPPAFSFVYGIPSKEVLKECKKRGITTIGTAITPDEVAALSDAEVDLIVATGFEAGGHRVSFLKPAEDSLFGTFSLIPQSVDRVKTPVIAAGGIADARGIVAAFQLGAQGVQIGTAFLACEESNAGDLHRSQLFSDAAKDTALTRVFSGRLARGIRNRFMTELAPQSSHIPPYPSQGWLTGHLKREAIKQGRADLMSLWSGQSAPLLRHKNAAVLFENLVSDVTRILGE